jgi:hypothetical protein
MNPGSNTFLRGFTAVMLLHLLQIVFLRILSLFLVGLTQLLYVIPIAWMAYQRHQTPRLQGILTAAGTTFLLNAICDFVILQVGLSAIP